MPQLTLQQAFDLARQHHRAGRLSAAEQIYRQILSQNPMHADALHRLGQLATQAGKPERARDLLRQSLAHKPHQPEALYDLATALGLTGQPAAAAAAYRQALALQPDFADACYGLGTALLHQRLFAEASAAFRQAIALAPNYAAAYSNLGTALSESGQPDPAIVAYRQALTLDPNLPEAHSNLAHALTRLGRLDEALAACRRALVLRPDYPAAHTNLGYVLGDQGNLDASLAAYDRAIALDPRDPEAHTHRAMKLLLRGAFLHGWDEYEWRQARPATPRRYAAPTQWDGSPLHGRTILLHDEQGFGDALHFIRYLPLVAHRGGRVILEAPPELCRLFQASFPGVPVVPHGQPLPPFDLHCPLLSLPRLFATTLANIPATVPYLQADPAAVHAWRQRLPSDSSSMLVGLVWAGRSTHSNDRNRSLALTTLAPLAQVPGVRFVSLQKGPAAIQTPPPGLQLLDLTSDLHDFADTAALVAALDLIISPDTSVAHLAGALAKPVWTLLPFVPDWRWLLERPDSPWYPTMRLFRQPAPNDWPSVIAHLAQALSPR